MKMGELVDDITIDPRKFSAPMYSTSITLADRTSQLSHSSQSP
jgi:hypothetical protein